MNWKSPSSGVVLTLALLTLMGCQAGLHGPRGQAVIPPMIDNADNPNVLIDTDPAVNPENVDDDVVVNNNNQTDGPGHDMEDDMEDDPAGHDSGAMASMFVERPGEAGYPELHTYTYNDLGRLTNETVAIGEGGAGGQFVTTITYNPDNTARLETSDPFGGVIRREKWTLDEFGRRTRRILVTADETPFEDLIFTFLGETNDPVRIAGSWDADGNGSLETRLRFTYSYNDSGQMERVNTRRADGAGVLQTSWTISYDEANCIDRLRISTAAVDVADNDYTCTITEDRLRTQTMSQILMPEAPIRIVTITYDPMSGNIGDAWVNLNPDGTFLEHRHYTWTMVPAAHRPTILDPLRGTWEGTVWQEVWESLSPLP